MPPPNVLWIMPDQLRGQALGCAGDPNAQTPTIDQLAATGARARQAITPYPICSAARAALLTGCHAHIAGLTRHGDLLPPDRRCAGHHFSAAGYRTCWIGKWHLAGVQGARGWKEGEDYWVHPLLRGGFADWMGFDCSNHLASTCYSEGEDIWPPRRLEGYQTDALTDLCLDWLDQRHDKAQPWFCCLSVEAPHRGTDAAGAYRNWAPPEDEACFDPHAITLRDNVPAEETTAARHCLAGYYAQIRNLDRNVARVLQRLDRLGLAENTVVMLFSDHGELGGSHGRYEKNEPYEESLRIPFIVRGPGIPAGRVIDGPFNLVDTLATTCGLTGIAPPPGQGLDWSAHLRGEADAPTTSTLAQWLGQARYGFSDYSWRALRTTTHSYCVGSEERHCQLFDLTQDPHQQHNRFHDPSMASLRSALHQQLLDAVIASGEEPQAWLRNPDHSSGHNSGHSAPYTLPRLSAAGLATTQAACLPGPLGCGPNAVL